MDKKCSKYEGLFIFSDKTELDKHLQECEECRKENEKMAKISDLIQEVKPYYLKKQSKSGILLGKWKLNFEACLLHVDKFNLKFLGYNENRGVSYARNLGIENSSGKYLIFCDYDDILNFELIRYKYCFGLFCEVLLRFF